MPKPPDLVVDSAEQDRQHPIVVIGAGPIGLAAAANLVERNLPFLILESGDRIAASMADWGHVRLFTPWSFLIDPACQRLLESAGEWNSPSLEDVPFAKELVGRYLDRIAALDSIAPQIRLQHKVIVVARDGHDRMKNGERDAAPFLIVIETPEGPRRILASAVIDASGTWSTPNPLGAGGVLADGEQEHHEVIRYGMPDILGQERSRYAGKRTLVVGSGHSAIGTALNIVELAKGEKHTQVAWAIRCRDPRRLWGGGDADEVAGRGALGTRIHEAVHSGAVHLLTGLSIAGLRMQGEGLEVIDVDGNAQVIVDEIVVATGARPDLSMLRELRLELDVPTESTKALGPLIDPNHHSCGSVPPHGAEELKHPETGFYMVGMKSYGRAPTFLLRTGYEQARSVVAELAGDHAAARRVELTLPQSGVCSSDYAEGNRSPLVGGQCC